LEKVRVITVFSVVGDQLQARLVVVAAHVLAIGRVQHQQRVAGQPFVQAAHLVVGM
jgi:hypothetical protein